MKINPVCLLTSSLLLFLLLQGCISEHKNLDTEYKQRILYVDQQGFGDTTSIQDAINLAYDNDTILVAGGVYNEHLIVDKKVTILGENIKTSIIDANYTDDALNIRSDHVIVKNFTIRHAGERGYPIYDAAIDIEGNNSNISNMLITDNTNGIYSAYSTHNTFYNNTITQTGEFGLYISFSESDLIEKNHFFNNYCSLKIKGSLNCTVKINYFNNSEKGMYFCCGSKNNTVYHNNFINNTNFNGDDQVGGNNWYNLESKQGNYWDDYQGFDTNGDGIGEESYNISSVASSDMYPLIKPIPFN